MNERFLEDLKSRIDIVEIVRKYAELKKSGKNYMCRSPFRNERSPSFCVSMEKQFWYDFGTSEGGDVISFLEKIENFSFPEAVEYLADIAGIEVPKKVGEKSVSREKKANIFDLHRHAALFFTKELANNQDASEYLKNRGISKKTITEWQLGYGGDGVDGLTKHLLNKGFSQAKIAESGVAFERDFGNKTMMDRFKKRLMVPIFEAKNGEIIAFTGRDLSGEKKIAKYVNSPENPVYHKSSTLFGLHRAKKKIRERDAVILVEGNFDVISMHAAGMSNCVATCGTSLTDDHLRALRRMTKNLFLAFDADLAGKKATLRSVEMCLKMELNPYIIDIVGGKDLDEMLQKDTEKTKKTIKNAMKALDFLFDKFADKNLNGSIDGEAKFLDSFFFFLKLVVRPIEIDDFIVKLSEKLNRSRQIIEQEFKRYLSKNKSTERVKKSREKKPKLSREESFAGFIGAFPKISRSLVGEKSEAFLKYFSDPNVCEILKKFFNEAAMSASEEIIFNAWLMQQENLYGDLFSEENQKKEFKGFFNKMKDEQQKNAKSTSDLERFYAQQAI